MKQYIHSSVTVQMILRLISFKFPTSPQKLKWHWTNFLPKPPIISLSFTSFSLNLSLSWAHTHTRIQLQTIRLTKSILINIHCKLIGNRLSCTTCILIGWCFDCLAISCYRKPTKRRNRKIHVIWTFSHLSIAARGHELASVILPHSKSTARIIPLTVNVANVQRHRVCVRLRVCVCAWIRLPFY